MFASGTRARLTSLTTPPKSTFPVRSHSVLSCTSINLPGTARHMRKLPFVGGGDDLAEGDPPVSWRNALRPVWRKSLVGQAPNRAFEQTPIEKTAAAQNHALMANGAGHGDDGFNQPGMKARRHLPWIDAATQISEE